jgi:integrase
MYLVGIRPSTAGSVSVQRSLQKGRGGLRFVEPKTPDSIRRIYLAPNALKVLKRYRTEQAGRRLALGEAWTNMDLVCDRGDGQPLYPDSFSAAFKRLAAKAGLSPKTRLHDIRHAVIIELGRRGNHPKKIADFAGHSDPAFTMRVYQKDWTDGLDDVAASLNDAFGEL